jgi:glucose/arabinose dehydrogenase|tara:strand:+ start:55 stop:1008 length:954 start_codon:yes stop_codon:yes gene_type:complete
MSGNLKLLDEDGRLLGNVSGVPEVAYGGQGGLGEIALHPSFERNNLVYISFAETGEDNTYGAAIIRAKLNLSEDGGSLSSVETIWKQYPKVPGQGHFGHRITFDEAGYLWISSGERQKFDPAQDMSSNLGKIIRLNDDGSIPVDNPFFFGEGITRELWSLGHRNPLGLAFDTDGRLWTVEMGPKDGDELNLVRRGANYGYPTVSNGDHYNGKKIPDHDTRHDFSPPTITWTPVISPSSMTFYAADAFPTWKGSAFIGGLSSKAIVRVGFEGDTAREIERFPMGFRVREVEAAPDGSIWVLEDGRRGDGSLIKLIPKG